MNCPNCGKELKENQKFCTNCGAEITETATNYKKIKKMVSIGFSVIFLLILVILIGINLSNEHKINQVLNNSSYNGNRILIKTNYKFNQYRKIIFDNELNSKYGESVYIAISAGNKAVIYSPKNIEPENIMSYLTRPVVKFKRNDNNCKWVDTGLNDKYIKKAEISTDQNGQWVVAFEFNETGANKFAELTKELTGKQLGIFYVDELISAPRVNEQILGGKAQISGGSGGFEYEEAKRMVNILNLNNNIQILEVK